MSRSGLDSALPRSNSVRIVASVIIKNNETTRLEIVSRVRRLLRRIFFRTSFANFIRVHLILEAIAEQKVLENEYAASTQRVHGNPPHCITAGGDIGYAPGKK
jgi:hypothetical protein